MKKAIEKWERGKNPVSGSSAALMYLLKTKPELADLLVKTNVKTKWHSQLEEQEQVRSFKATQLKPAYYSSRSIGAVPSLG